MFLEHSIFHKEEGLEDCSFFKDRLGMWRHGPWSDSADVCMMAAACDKKHRSLMTPVKHLAMLQHTTVNDTKFKISLIN